MEESVSDLVVEGATAIAVFESPHTEEVRTGTPLSGDSGCLVSQGLGVRSTVPMGQLVEEGQINLSIVNSFEYALQLSANLCQLNRAIKTVKFKELGLIRYKKKIYQIIQDFDQQKNYKNSYVKRMNTAISCLEATPKILVCGILAQVFFEYAYDLSDMGFGSIMTKSLNGVSCQVMYVDHPSPRNNSKFWEPYTNHNLKLRSFLNLV